MLTDAEKVILSHCEHCIFISKQDSDYDLTDSYKSLLKYCKEHGLGDLFAAHVNHVLSHFENHSPNEKRYLIMASIADSLRKATKQAPESVQPKPASTITATTAYQMNPQVLTVLEAAYKHKQPMILVGPPGTGKTTSVEEFARIKGVPYLRKPIEADTEASELSFVRQVGYTNGQAEIVFELSNVLQFIQSPGILLIDEPFQSLSGSCLAPLRTILDEGKCYIPDGRVIDKHPDCWIVFADNTKGAGENYEKYQRNIQDASLISRIDICLEYDYLPEQQETALVMGLCSLNEQDAVKLVKLANLTRIAYRKGELSRVITLRQIKAIGKLGMAPKDALKYVFRNTLSSDSELQAYDAMQRTVY